MKTRERIISMVFTIILAVILLFVHRDRKEYLTVRVNNYYPQAGAEIGLMANGEKYIENVNRAATCPDFLELGTRIRFSDGTIWECMDRNPLNTDINAPVQVNLLTDSPPYYAHGHTVTVEVLQ